MYDELTDTKISEFLNEFITDFSVYIPSYLYLINEGLYGKTNEIP